MPSVGHLFVADGGVPGDGFARVGANGGQARPLNADYSWAEKTAAVCHCFVGSSAVHNGRALLALRQAVAHRHE